MKKTFFYFLPILIVASCNNTQQNDIATTDTITETGTATNTINVPGKMCFQAVLQRDTVGVELFIKDSSVSGNLIYNFFEKDDSKGVFTGKVSGDIIKADYSFVSEGATSVREVMFMLKDNILTEGYGEMEEKDNKSVFKNPAKVQFSQVYNSIACP